MISQQTLVEQKIYSKLSLLDSGPLKQELLFFIDYLLSRQYINEQKKHTPKFGCAKGMFEMAPDFDEPLEDFNDYMP